MFYNGWWDVPDEGSFSTANDPNDVLPSDGFHPWYLGEPNGDTLENCAVVWPLRNAWNDVSCSFPTCSFCELERAPDIQIRGR